jgi:hypothetical protein
MAYNLFLDDVRVPMNIGDIQFWTIARSYSEFVKVITERGLPDLVSFDHDLAADHYPTCLADMQVSIDYNKYKEKTGYHCALWLVEYCKEHDEPLPQWQVHSMNPVGKINIARLLTRFEKESVSYLSKEE